MPKQTKPVVTIPDDRPVITPEFCDALHNLVDNGGTPEWIAGQAYRIATVYAQRLWTGRQRGVCGPTLEEFFIDSGPLDSPTSHR